MICWRKFSTVFLLGSCLLLISCRSKTVARFDTARESTGSVTSMEDRALSESSLNRYFPDSGSGYERIYTQQEKGFTLAKLKKDDWEIAILAISDVSSNPSTVNKFQDSTDKIEGYPVVNQGKTGTAILVSDRYQVKIRSKDVSFTQSDRQKWLEKFDLRGLSKLN